MPKFIDVPGEPFRVLCEQCGARGPGADSIQEAMRDACELDNWGYRWHHGETHYAEFFCPKCKVQFDLDFAGGKR
jgi:hypothetical protein